MCGEARISMRQVSALALVATMSMGLTNAWGVVTQPPTEGQPAPALKGPRVRDRQLPGGGTGEFGGGDRRRMGDRLQPQVYREALGVLTAPDAPADIRATAQQQEKIRALIAAHEEAVRAYRAAHRDEIASMEKSGRDRRRPGDSGEMMPPPDNDPAMEEVRTKRRELAEGAPKIEGVYEKVWAELTEPQRKAVEAKLQEVRDQRAKQREEAYVRQRMGEKKEGEPGAAARPAPAARPRVAAAEGGRRERLMRLYERLSPEEQEALLARLEQRLAERRDDGEPKVKPRPDVDKVKVPKPDNGR